MSEQSAPPPPVNSRAEDFPPDFSFKDADLLGDETRALYEEVLGFLERVHAERGSYTPSDGSKESSLDVLMLNYVKVVDDCRAMLLMGASGYFIQGGILARSTMDACNLMMHVAFEWDAATLAQQWKEGTRVEHWDIQSRLNSFFGGKLDADGYRRNRKRLDDFVHGNFSAVRYYPAQAPGPTRMDFHTYAALTFWRDLIVLYLVSCLLVVDSIEPDLGETADSYLVRLQEDERKLASAG